ncbi:hypothetical protein ACVW03_002433 [Pantoea agglomerans]
MSASAASKNLAPIVMPIAVLLIAMLSLQGGASLAKSLFPAVGATGITALRLGFGTLILCIIFKPWRLRFSREQRLPLLMYGLALGTMNFTFYLAIRTVPLGVAVGLEFTGPLALALFGSRRPLDFVWVLLAVIGLWFLLPFGTGMTAIDPLGAALAVSAGACWAIYILAGQRAGAEHGPATVAIGSLDCLSDFCTAGADVRRKWHLDMGRYADRVAGCPALQRHSLFAGDGRPHPLTGAHLRHADESGTRYGCLFRHAVSGGNPDRASVAGAAGDHHRLGRFNADHAAEKESVKQR